MIEAEIEHGALAVVVDDAHCIVGVEVEPVKPYAHPSVVIVVETLLSAPVGVEVELLEIGMVGVHIPKVGVSHLPRACEA